MLITMVAITMPVLPNTPKPSTARPVAESTVAAIAAEPSTSNSIRLRTRDRIGSGRTLRGTAHTVFIAFCTAWPIPEPPYSAPRMPTTTAATPPLSFSGWASCSPISGNWLTVASTTCCCSSGRPTSTTPSTVVSNSSSGNSETNA